MSLMLPFHTSADTIRNTTKELRNVAAQYTASNKVTQLCPAPSNSREMLAHIATQDAREGTQGGRKRHKQRLQEASTTTANDGGNSKRVDGSDVVHVMAAVGSGKHQARPPTDHLEKLLERPCTNHAYLIKHKLRDYTVMNNFMASGSLT
jgi:hypothetical protein